MPHSPYWICSNTLTYGADGVAGAAFSTAAHLARVVFLAAAANGRLGLTFRKSAGTGGGSPPTRSGSRSRSDAGGRSSPAW